MIWYQKILKFFLKGKRIKYFTIDFLTFLKYRTKDSILFIDFRIILIQNKYLKLFNLDLKDYDIVKKKIFFFL